MFQQQKQKTTEIVFVRFLLKFSCEKIIIQIESCGFNQQIIENRGPY